jgi:4-hydroxy-2-oxoheptanedioate aldolase
MLKKVKGIGAILIGEGDLSQELGYRAPVRAPRSAQAHGRDRQDRQVVQRRRRPSARRFQERRARVEEGYRFLMPAPERTFNGLNKGRELAGR